MMGKLKRFEAHLRATLPRITKMTIGEDVRVQPVTTFPLSERENIPIEQEEKEEKKIFFFFLISYQYNIRQ